METGIRALLEQKPLEEAEVLKKVYDTLMLIKDAPEKKGFSICIGYRPEHDCAHVYPMDIDLYKQQSMNVKDENFRESLNIAANFDGAILVSSAGDILHSGMYFRHDPGETLLRMGKEKGNDYLWKSYGFAMPVGTRHLSAISASYYMPHTVILVLSEEYHSIRIFQQGTMAYSPFATETNT